MSVIQNKETLKWLEAGRKTKRRKAFQAKRRVYPNLAWVPSHFSLSDFRVVDSLQLSADVGVSVSWVY
jgi:hypothetical protein